VRATNLGIALLGAGLLCAIPADGMRVEQEGRGHLLLNGGGGEATGYWPKFFELAGGKDQPIVILPTASERAEAGQEYVDELLPLGATNVRWLPLRAREDASKPEIVEAIGAAKAIFFTGGDQSRITAAILGTPAEAAVRKVYERGGVLGGSSAGLACMSEKMITGNGDFTLLTAGNVEIVRGLGYVTEAIVDQHFVARQRQNRLISGVLENPTLLGVGVDERTTIWIKPDRTFEVLGDGWVMIFDARRSAIRTLPPVAADAKQPRLAADPIVTRILVAGDRFDLESGEPIR
jgi:cyanophycinase